MDEKAFRGILGHLHAIFDRKLPPEATYLAWWDELKFVPTEAMNEIAGDFKNLESWPRNFPLAIKNMWRDWLGRNPHKQVFQKIGCDMCSGGWLTLSKFVENWTNKTSEGITTEKLNVWSNLAVRCYRCNGGKKNFTQLLEEGYCKPMGVVLSFYHQKFPDNTWERPESKYQPKELFNEEDLPF